VTGISRGGFDGKWLGGAYEGAARFRRGFGNGLTFLAIGNSLIIKNLNRAWPWRRFGRRNQAGELGGSRIGPVSRDGPLRRENTLKATLSYAWGLFLWGWL